MHIEFSKDRKQMKENGLSAEDIRQIKKAMNGQLGALFMDIRNDMLSSPSRKIWNF